MLESIINYLSNMPWGWVLFFAFLIPLIENLFPPAPCDSLLVFIGTLVGINVVGFIPVLLAATLGSTAGFLIMFFVGRYFGVRVVNSRKIKFITPESLKKPRAWLNKYGYFLIIANRFLTGTRAVISFLAGLSNLRFSITSILSALSALIWNCILIYAGVLLGNNWRVADYYLNLYGRIITPIVIIIIIVLVFLWLNNRRKEKVKEVEITIEADE
ncbi:MAG: DedA family protein [Bacteroidota bacterium]